MRSRWKFVFVDLDLVVKCLQIKFYLELTNVVKSDAFLIKIWKKSSVILSTFVGYKFLVYNGKKFWPITVTDKMIGYKFGEFVLTKKIGSTIHKIKKKRRRKY